jgi:hypothetical protein
MMETAGMTSKTLLLAFLDLTGCACSGDRHDSGRDSTEPESGIDTDAASVAGPAITAVTAGRIEAANAEAGNWLSHGGYSNRG